MWFRIDRIVSVACAVAVSAIGVQRPVHAQISAGELWRPDAGARDYFGSRMEASVDTLAVQSDARIDVYDVSTGEPRWRQVLTRNDFPGWLQTSDTYMPPIVALHGDWMVLGDQWLELGGNTSAGAAYLFHRDSEGWAFFDRLSAPAPKEWAYFGYSADLDDSTLVIGELGLSDKNGLVHVFERRGGGWERVHVLEGPAPGWMFGADVAVSHDWLLIGAPFESNDESQHAYVHFFRRQSEEPAAPWTLMQSFNSEYSFVLAAFGGEVALEGDLAVASDPGITGGPGHDTFAFRRTAADVWVKFQTITSPDNFPWSGSNPNGFGRELHLRGRDLVLASPYFDVVNGSAGMAYHYRLENSHWDYLGALLPPQQDRVEQLGSSVALAGGRAFVGARLKGFFWDDWIGFPIVVGAYGAAYAFDLSPDAQQSCSCPSGSPCGNIDSTGGCANSTGAGGVLTSAGSGSLAADDLRLQAFDLPPWQIAVLAIGDQAVAMPFGDGRLCVWGDVVQAPGVSSSARGQVEWAPGLAGLAASLGDPIQPGELRHVQLFYRDPLGPCGTGINLTNAVRVDFKP